MTGYVRPRDVAEALAARREHPDWIVLAGGTDLLVDANKRPEPPGVIDLFGLSPLCQIRQRDGGSMKTGTIEIGAAATYAAILRSDLLWRELPILCEAAREVGALQIQARGTLGGNVGTSSPVGDTLPVLLALDAEVDLASAGATRSIPYAEFCTGYRTTALAADELIVAFRFPRPRPGTRQFWRKVGTRRAQSISKVMLAAAAIVDRGRIAHMRLGLGAVAARPIRAFATEAAVLGRPPGTGAASLARAALANEITPIDDIRSTADYRLHVAQNLVGRFISSLAE